MYAFEIFFSVLSPQGVDHGKGKKLSLAENFLFSSRNSPLTTQLENFGVGLGMEIKIFSLYL